MEWTASYENKKYSIYNNEQKQHNKVEDDVE